eukprot:1152842-Pelagomonas_calceolata.AAC.5
MGQIEDTSGREPFTSLTARAAANHELPPHPEGDPQPGCTCSARLRCQDVRVHWLPDLQGVIDVCNDRLTCAVARCCAVRRCASSRTHRMTHAHETMTPRTTGGDPMHMPEQDPQDDART